MAGMVVGLSEFRKERARDLVRYSLPVSDEVGEQNHELLIVGRERQIRESLGVSEFEVTILPGVTEDDWASEMSRHVASSGEVAPREAFDDLTSWFKDPPPRPTADESVLIALRRERGHGTGYRMDIRSLSLPGSSAFFVPATGPLGISWIASQSQPISGDPDLFLSLSGSIARAAISSTFPDGWWDTVWAVRPIFSVMGLFPTVLVVPFTACSTMLSTWWWCL